MQVLHESGKLCVASLRSACTSAITAQAMREASQALPMQASVSGEPSPHTYAACVQRVLSLCTGACLRSALFF